MLDSDFENAPLLSLCFFRKATLSDLILYESSDSFELADLMMASEIGSDDILWEVSDPVKILVF